jgi:hypothetical protein
MDTGDHTFYQQNWLHLMGPLDALLEEARGNGSQLEQADHTLGRLLDQAEQERAAVEAAFQGFMERRERLTHMLDHIQRELAVAGLPLKGDII